MLCHEALHAFEAGEGRVFYNEWMKLRAIRENKE
jgi:hypothetical protein